MKKILSILISFLLVDSLLAKAGVDSVGEPLTLWKKKEIRVCWGSPQDFSKTFASSMEIKSELPTLDSKKLGEFDPAKRILVQKIITEEYSRDRFGISFVGWESCAEKDESDVILLTSTYEPASLVRSRDFVKNPPLGRASIGEGGELVEFMDRWMKSNKKLKSYVFLRYSRENGSLKISPEDSLRMTAVHEFGHLLGLRHEQVREESQDDLNCMLVNFKNFEKTNRSTQVYGAYDPNSIMSYCFNFLLKYHRGLDFVSIQEMNLADPLLVSHEKLGNGQHHYQVKIGLSSGDIHTLKCLYGQYPAEERARVCQPE